MNMDNSLVALDSRLAVCWMIHDGPRKRFLFVILIIAWVMIGEFASAQDRVVGNDDPLSVEGSTERIDATTLLGKVMCGYQGWFNCEGDRSNLGWTHWARDGRRKMGPGNATVDLWPDVSELPMDSRYPTGFHHADGRAGEVFSSADPEVVAMHFRWMQEYGIDGVFLQRFANGLDRGRLQQHKDQVLSHVRTQASLRGRVFSVMYDLSGLRGGQTKCVLDDWRQLKEQGLQQDKSYLHHRGKPLVAVWGIGFNDGRRYTLQECLQLVKSLKAEGCCVMIGVPSWWREGKRDATEDPLLREIAQQVDVISPWSIGRYQTPDQALRHAAEVWENDLKWCESRKVDFLPVAFPGFSWHQLKGGDLDMIPRRGGDFLWSQVYGANRAGCRMLYIAMFDEVDEGTAIFKCDRNPPISETEKFLSLSETPSDHYLRVVGEASRGIRGEISVERKMPPSLSASRSSATK